MIRSSRLGLTPGEPPLPYDRGLAEQLARHADVVAGRSEGALLLVQHESVYTAGTRTQPTDLPRDGSAVVDAGRGGRITWHGPGQLVAYPIVRLPEPLDVVAYVRGLEQCLLRVCADVGVTATLVEGRSGIWIPGAGSSVSAEAERTAPPSDKVAAVGIRVAEGVTMHGVALNCDNSLEPYAVIVPCGIADAGVTTLSIATGRHVSVGDVVDALERELLAFLEELSPATAHARAEVAA